MICAIIASELDSSGRAEISSFQALVTGKTCIADTIVSACAVLNTTVLVTTGAGPRIRPSWLTRSAQTPASDTRRSSHRNQKCLTERPITSGLNEQVKRQKPGWNLAP